MPFSVTTERFALAEVFSISRGSKSEAEVLTVRAFDRGCAGAGECVPYARYGESLDSVAAEIEGLPDGIGRHDLQDALPAGAARNAADCALWDLQAKITGAPVWQLAGLVRPRPVNDRLHPVASGPPRRMEAAAGRTRSARSER